jgi:hypothetical protein
MRKLLLAILIGVSPAKVVAAPLTEYEINEILLAVWACYTPAFPLLDVTIKVSFEISDVGKVDESSIQMVEPTSGNNFAAIRTFEAAKLAILRCQASEGYQFSREKREYWQNLELEFGPTMVSWPN